MKNLYHITVCIVMIFLSSYTVKAQCTADAGADNLVCGFAYQLDASNSSGSGTWSGLGSFNNSASAITTVTIPYLGEFTFTYTVSDGGCSSTDEIVVHFLPSGNYVPPPLTVGVCGLEADLQVDLGYSGYWSGGPVGTVFSDVNDPNSHVTVPALGQYTFIWHEENDCYQGDHSVTVNFNDQAATAFAGYDYNNCGNSFVLDANQPFNGMGTWTGPGFINDVNDPNAQVTVGPGAYGDYTYVWTVESDCGGTTVSAADEVTITYTNNIAVAGAGQDTETCGFTFQLEGIKPKFCIGEWSGPDGVEFSSSGFPISFVTVLEEGDYEFIWTVNCQDQCQDADTVRISFIQPASTPFILTGENSQVCGLTGQLDAVNPVFGTGTWTGPAGVVFSAANSPSSSVTVPSPGMYTFYYATDNGSDCTPEPDSVTINFLAGTSVSAGDDAEICGDSHTLSGTQGVIGSWSSLDAGVVFSNANAFNSSVTVSNPGVYTLTYTTADSDCGSGADDVVLTFIEEPAVPNIGEDGYVCGDNYTFNASVVGGSWTASSPDVIVSNPLHPMTTVTALVAGTYTFTYTIANSCGTTSDIAEVTFVQDATVAIATVVDGTLDLTAICSESISLLGNNPNPGVGQWTSSNSGVVFSNSAGPATDVSIPGPGTYTFNWTISNECSNSTDPVTATFLASAIADAGSDISVCEGSVQLSATAPATGTGTWTVVQGSGTFDNENSPTSSVSNLGTGLNVFSWTVGQGACSDSDDVAVTLFETTVPANGGPDAEVCGLTYILGANSPAGGSGTWSAGGSNISFSDINDPGATVTSTSYGVVTLIWSISGDCGQDTDPIQITFCQEPSIADAGADASVCGLTYTLDGNSPFVGSGIWTGSGVQDPSDPNSSITAPNYGTYTYTWTISNCSCPTSSNTVSITFDEAVTANAGNNASVCDGSSYQLNAGALTNGTGLWTILSGSGAIAGAASPTATVNNLAAGNNVFLWTVTNGSCSDSDEVTIEVNQGSSANATGAGTYCEGSNVQLGATGGNTYSWTGPNGFSSGLANPLLTNITSAQSGTYTVSVSNNGDCQSTSSVEVVVGSSLNIAATASETQLCAGEQLQLSTSGGGTYSWSGPNGFSSSSASPIIPNISTAGAGIYTVAVSNGAGCSDVASVEISVDALVEADAGADADVCGNSYILQANSASPGIGTWTVVQGAGNVVDVNNPSATANNLSMGTNLLVWTIKNGQCTSSDEVVIFVLPEANVFIASNSPVCGGEDITLSTVQAASYSWTGPNGFSSSAASVVIPNASMANAGIYSVTVMLADGCQSTGSINVEVGEGGASTATSNGPICEGDDIELFGSGGTTYMWTGPNGFTSTLQNPEIEDASTAAEGIYSLTVDNGTGGDCGTSSSTFVGVTEDINSYAGTDVGVCITTGFYVMDADLPATATGTWTLLSGAGNISDPTNPNAVITGIGVGVNEFQWTIINGPCVDDDEMNIYLYDVPTATLNGPDEVCAGEEIVLTATGGLNYEWSGPDGFNSDDAETVTISDVDEDNLGVYTVTVFDLDGCSDTKSIYIQVLESSAATASSNSPVCTGETLGLFGGGGLFYSWTGPNGFTSSQQNPLINNTTVAASGLYTLTTTGTDAECSTTASVMVEVGDGIDATATASPNPVCMGDDFQLFANGGSNYSWVGPNGFTSNQANPLITSGDMGTYTVTVSNGSIECSGTASVDVQFANTMTVTADSNSPICEGGMINLTASGGQSYLWSGPNNFSSSQQNPSISLASASDEGEYTVAIISAEGCTATASATVELSSDVEGSASDNGPICDGQTLQLFAPDGESFSWTGPGGFTSNDQNPMLINASPASTGTYNVLVVNESGCSSTFSTTVEVVAHATVMVSSNSPVCEGDAIQLMASGGNTYQWTGPNGFTSFEQNPTISNSSSANVGAYTVAVINAGGCSGSASVDVGVNQGTATADAGSAPDEICGDSYDLNASGVGSWIDYADDPVTYSDASSGQSTVMVSEPGTYTFIWVVSGQCGTSQDELNITFGDNPSPAYAGADISLCAMEFQLEAIAAGGGVGTWSGPGTFSDVNNPNSVVSVDAPGSYTYTWTVTNDLCPANTDEVEVTFLNMPDVDTYGSNIGFCPGEDVTITATGADTYTWTYPSGATVSGSSITIASASPSDAGIYLVTGMVAGLCPDTEEVEIGVNEDLDASATSGGSSCVGDVVELIGSGGTHYSWSGPNGFSSTAQNPVLTNVQMSDAGLYTLTVMDDNGCMKDDETIVIINEEPSVSVNGDSGICEGEDLQLSASGGVNFYWTGPNGFESSEQSPLIFNAGLDAQGVYTVNVTNGEGCSASTTILIDILPLPNASINGSLSACIGSDIQLSAFGGTSYFWSGPNAFSSTDDDPTIFASTAAAEGIYACVITSGGCSQVLTVEIEVNNCNSAPDANDDSETTDENTAVTIDVLGNDTDPDDDDLNVCMQTGDGEASNGSVSVNSDGTITYTPDNGFVGVDSFTYTICDENGEMDQATVYITIVSTNEPPVAVDDQENTDEDTAVTINVLSDDSDPDGDDLTICMQPGDGLPSNGSVSVNADGTITYTPDNGFVGTDSFTYTICDEEGLSDQATVTVSIISTNLPPDANDDNETTLEDTPVTVQVLNNDDDPNNDDLTLCLQAGDGQPSNGFISVNADGSITYNPNDDFVGTDSFTYTICDEDGEMDQATVTITVTSTNQPPVAVNDTESTDEDTAVIVNILGNDSDPDGDDINVCMQTGDGEPSNGSVSVNSIGTITYTPDSGFVGTDSFTYTICDEDGEMDQATVTITIISTNVPPIAVNDSENTDEGTAVTIDVLNNDSDSNGDDINVCMQTGDGEPSNGFISINANGTITYTPNDGYVGSDSFTYTICDEDGEMDQATVTINISSTNEPPIAVNDSENTDENTAVEIDVLDNDSDPDGDDITVCMQAGDGQPANGFVSINSDGTFSYEPNDGFTGTDSFTYTICDEEGLQDQATVTIYVNNVNEAPDCEDDDWSASEICVGESIMMNVLANDSDPEMDDLSICLESGDGDASHGTVALNAEGALTYTATSSGSDSFTYTVCDGEGGSCQATVSVSTSNCNEAPVCNTIYVEACAGEEVEIDLFDFVSDSNNDDLSVCFETGDGDALIGSVMLGSGGVVLYTGSEQGYDEFSYTVCDENGASCSDFIYVQVDNCNEIPDAQPDVAQTEEDESVTIDVMDNDNDPDGDGLTICLQPGDGQPDNGVISVNADGSITYTPDDGFYGTDSFTYTICDGNGDMDQTTVTITVEEDDVQPCDYELYYETCELEAIVICNDWCDLDGAELTSVHSFYSCTTTFLDDNCFNYQPLPAFVNLTDQLIITYCNGDDCQTINVEIHVTECEEEECEYETEYCTQPVTPLIICNDWCDVDDASILGISSLYGCSVSLLDDNCFQYVPLPQWYGNDEILITYCNEDNECGQITLNILTADDCEDPVTPPSNNPPDANTDSAETNENVAVVIDVLDNDEDPDGDDLSFCLEADDLKPDNGTAELHNGDIIYTPDDGFYGEDSFTYTICDGEGGSDQTTVYVTVMEDCENIFYECALPVTVVELCPEFCQLSGDVTLTGATSAFDCSLTNLPNGCIRYIGLPSQQGVDEVTVTGCDENGNCSEAVYFIDLSGCGNIFAGNDDIIIDEDEEVTIDATGNDDGVGSLTITEIADPMNGTASLDADGNIVYSPDADYNGADVFTYTIVDADGNEATGSVFVLINAVDDESDLTDGGDLQTDGSSDQAAQNEAKTDCVIHVPNTFTPNGDGVNDALTVKDIYCFTRHEFKVFDRYGRLVYEASDIIPERGITWNGLSTDGSPLVRGTYFFVIELESDLMGVHRKSGFVEMVK